MDIADSPVINPEIDNTFWLVLASGLPQAIISNPVLCIVLDVLVLATALLAFTRKDKTTVTRIFLVLFFLQTIINETYTSQHSKTVVCIFLVLLPFCFKGAVFKRLWEFARYFLVFILLSAAYYKFKNGGLGHPDQMIHILMTQHADIMILAPDYWQSRLATWLISVPSFTNALYYLLFFSQLTFIAALFTRRFDRLLSVILFSFCILTYVLMRIYNFDLLIMVFPLWFSSVYFADQRPGHAYYQSTIILQ